MTSANSQDKIKASKQAEKDAYAAKAAARHAVDVQNAEQVAEALKHLEAAARILHAAADASKAVGLWGDVTVLRETALKVDSLISHDNGEAGLKAYCETLQNSLS